MDSGDGHSAFADRRCATLHRSRADVAGGKDSGKTCFKRSGAAFVSAPRWCFSDIGTSLDESLIVPLDFRWQPLCAWAGANHLKDRWRFDSATLPCFRVFQFDLLELLVAKHLSNLCSIKNFYVRLGLHATCEVVGHFFGNVIAANDEQHFRGAIGKKHGCLSGRVAT